MSVVAVKALHVFDPAFRAQLKAELGVYLDLKNKSIIRMRGAYFEDGWVTLVLELLSRGDLEGALRVHGPLPAPALRWVALHAARGLAALHQAQQVHRDVKPANILIDHRGGVKLADFGLAKQLQAAEYTLSAGGTIAYLSPERALHGVTSYAADVWALGLTLRRLATGEMPVPQEFWGVLAFMSAPEEDMPLRLDPQRFPDADMRDFVAQCLRKEPGQRATVEALLKHPWLAPHRRRRRQRLSEEEEDEGDEEEEEEEEQAPELPWMDERAPTAAEADDVAAALAALRARAASASASQHAPGSASTDQGAAATSGPGGASRDEDALRLAAIAAQLGWNLPATQVAVAAAEARAGLL
jgi:serine/threonine protein kinase